jgi:hypothetical protein
MPDGDRLRPEVPAAEAVRFAARGLHVARRPDRCPRHRKRGLSRSRRDLGATACEGGRRDEGAPGRLDAGTHRPVGTRFVADGKVFDAQVYRFLGTVPAAKVSFLVPDDGVPRSYLSSLNSFPYGFFGPRVSAGGSERASPGRHATF